MSVTMIQEARAKKREKREHSVLHEVNAYFNHHAGERYAETRGMLKTLHRGVDLTLAGAKQRRLEMVHGFKRGRFEYAIAGVEGARECVLLVHMPKTWMVLSVDDFVVPMGEYGLKIVEMTQEGKLGLWKSV